MIEKSNPSENDMESQRHQTERPPMQREGVVSDPDQYFAPLPSPAPVVPPGREARRPSNPDQ